MPREILLTQGHVAIVDDEDFDRLNAHRWRILKGFGSLNFSPQDALAFDPAKLPHTVRLEVLTPIPF